MIDKFTTFFDTFNGSKSAVEDLVELFNELDNNYGAYTKDEYATNVKDVLGKLALDARVSNEDFSDAFESIYGWYVKYNPRLFKWKIDILKAQIFNLIKRHESSSVIRLTKEFVYNSLAEFCNTPDCTNYKQDYFSFRSFSEYSLADVQNETISVAHPRNFNDPLDTLLNLWIDKEIKSIADDTSNYSELALLLKKVGEHIKMRCLIGSRDEQGNTKEIEGLPTLMWAHYAKSHKGFCIKYHFNKDFFPTIESRLGKMILIGKVKYNDNVNISTFPNISDGLFVKSKDWSYENEMRLIYYDTGNSDRFPLLPSKNAIEAIYLGVNCTDENRRKMEEAIGDKDIELYQMKINPSNLSKLMKVRIG